MKRRGINSSASQNNNRKGQMRFVREEVVKRAVENAKIREQQSYFDDQSRYYNGRRSENEDDGPSKKKKQKKIHRAKCNDQNNGLPIDDFCHLVNNT